MGDVDFSSLTDGNDIVTLHETGHFVVMYALGLYDNFISITNKAAGGTLGLTDCRFDELSVFSPKFLELNQKAGNSVEGYDELSHFWFAESPMTFFPQICRLFAGGSICRYYKLDADDLCTIDNDLIRQILVIWGVKDENFQSLQNVVDAFLANVFVRYKSLVNVVYASLKVAGYIDKAAMDTIVNIWKESMSGVIG